MSASTHTRRDSTPSMANVMTRAITSDPIPELGPLEGVLQVVQPDELVVDVERHAHRVEPQLGVVRPVGDLAQPRGGHLAHLAALVLVQVLAPVAVAEPARLDLAEDDRVVRLVGENQIELAPARAVVAREHAVAEAHEVLCGELLSAAAQLSRAFRRHRGATVWPPAERISTLRSNVCAESAAELQRRASRGPAEPFCGKFQTLRAHNLPTFV